MLNKFTMIFAAGVVLGALFKGLLVIGGILFFMGFLGYLFLKFRKGK